MAQDKKSVLLYCDIIFTVESLTDDEAGRLFKHYLRYVNDLNPEPPDRLTQITFEPIKQNLKRDLRKWENKSIRNTEIIKDYWNNKKGAKKPIKPDPQPETTPTIYKENLTEHLFNDLPNSQLFMETFNRAGIRHNLALERFDDFKKVANPTYKNMDDMVKHFKNWYLKIGSKVETSKIETALSINEKLKRK